MTGKWRSPVVLALSLALLAAACSSRDQEVSETATNQSIAATADDQPEATTETTTPGQETASIVWHRTAHDEDVFGGDARQRMRSVAASPSVLVAVGFDTSGGDFDAAVWTSPDGLVWSRVEHDEAVLGGDGNQQMDDVVLAESGFVAVGLQRVDDDTDAAVWTSPDGLVWSRVAHDEAVFGGELYQDMSSVVGAESGLVAVGEESQDDDGDAAVWTSPDGTVWSRVAHDEAVFGGDDSQKMMSVAVWGTGFVAVGMDMSGGDFDAAVWTSPDGLVWSRVAHDETVFGGDANQQLDDVTVTVSGLVAVGLEESNEDWDTAVWTSPDGTVWSRVAHDEAAFGGDANQQAVSLVTTGSAVVIVGDEEAGGDFDAAVWMGVYEG